MLSICPIKKTVNAEFLRWLGVTIEDELVSRLASDPEKLLANSIEYLVGMWKQIRGHVAEKEIRTPLGLNIAPVGPIPPEATIELIGRLRSN
ncbi:MAG: hypothetical protein ACRD1Z_16480 [Vicinamibacteria bacterium]